MNLQAVLSERLRKMTLPEAYPANSYPLFIIDYLAAIGDRRD